ncbi:MAG: zinc-ribbon domain-containing protein, partial [Polyangiaceae bacterium]|nr:zinc-ribbon domain-containing protein [Polyangiaceae bacterium]
MDVRCEQCETEYEFDDALVSGRGTTVRCTTCGHQFKVRRIDANGPVQDEWIVQTAEGRTTTFLTLRELQRAILSKAVRRDDLLARPGTAPRVLASIQELEPFFEGRTSSRSDAGAQPPAPPAAEATSPVVSVQRLASTPPMRQKIDTLRPPLTAGAAPPPAEVTSEGPPIEGQPVVAVRPEGDPPRPAATGASAGPVAPADAPAHFGGAEGGAAGGRDASPLPPPTRPMLRPPAHDDPLGFGQPATYEEPYSMTRRGRVGGWVVALTLLLAVGVVGWAVAKPYLVAREAGAAAQLDPRAQAFLAQGEAAMVGGNLDVAQEDFDKASALAEHDPRVLLDQARLTAAKADIPWLKLRLLPPDAANDFRTTKAQLDDLLTRARRQADDAVAAAPRDPAAIRSKIDALRLSGEREAARAEVARMGSPSEQAETAYVLAALDLAEPSPLWTTATERLRSAAAVESNGGRARAALIYALARSGDVSAARAEI